jgi:signal transduction histidine kinase
VRLRTAVLVKSAAEDAAEGELDPGRLTMADDLGRAATGWNRLVQAMHSGGLETIVETLGSGGAERNPGDDPSDLALAFSGAPQGMLIIDRDGTISRANAASALLLGKSVADLVGKPISTVLTDADVIKIILDVASRQAKTARSIEIRSEIGDTQLRCGAFPLGGASGTRTLVMLEDITQQAASREAQQMFLAHAAHELRTPLTNIRLNVEEIVDSEPDDEATRTEAINVIAQESRRLESIVNDLLSMSEIEAGSIQLRGGDVRMENLLQDLQADYKAKAAERNIALTFELPAKIAVIRGDRDKIELVMHNMIGNALKYTPPGGTVRVCYTEDEDRVRIDVVDSGIGIGPSEIDKIFDRFYRSKDPRIEGIEGTGLGLAISRELVRLHGGELIAESELGKGSTFSMLLPKRLRPSQAA